MVFWPLTTPEHPHTSTAGRSVTTHNKARLTREGSTGDSASALLAFLFCSNFIVQAPRTLLDVRVRL